MNKHLFTRCSSVCRFFIIALAFGLFSLTVNAQVNIPGIAPVSIPNGGFAVDGDALANFPTPGPYSNAGDWFSDVAYPGAGGTIFDMTTSDPFDFVSGLVTPDVMAIHYNDPYSGIDPTTFTSSNKINDDPNTYTWGAASAGSPPKNEINNATVSFSWGNPALGGNADDLWAIVAGDRQTTNGSSYIDFEFLQNSLVMTGSGSGGFTSTGPDGGRTLGDVLVTLEFINGGVVAVVVINKWSLVNGQYMYVEQDINNYTGDVFCTANTTVTVAPWLPFGQTQYEINQYAEAAINLSTLFNFSANSCGAISTVFVRTRSSGNSSQSELKDLPGAPFQVNLNLDDLAINCPTDVAIPSCTALSDITTAFNDWKAGFTYEGGIGTVVTNVGDLPSSLPSDVRCGYELTFTFEVYDDCTEEPLTCTSTFSVAGDETAPVFADAPADATYQCIGDVPAAGYLTWTDACDGTGQVLGVDVSDGNTCPEVITRTWSYTDACGNPASVSQTITVDDDTAPVFADAPADATYQCIGDVPAAGMLGWTDNCDGSGEVLGSDVSDGNTCPEVITRTWSYTDACGNPASVSQTITVDDDTAPVFADAPADATYQCIGDVPAAGMLGWTDNCDGSGEVLGTDVSDGNTCPEVITRTWSYTDACGNPATVSQTITVDDDTAPEFADAPADATYQCIGDVPAAGMLGWTDNCDGSGEVQGTDVSDGNTCPEVITRTWSYTDACGNPATVSQTITVDDDTAPVFADAPDDATYQCIGDVPAAGMLGWIDNCDGSGEVMGSDVSDGNTCPEVITRTWSYTDACGNPATVSQTITVDDDTAPVFADAPAYATYQCIDDVPAAGMLGWTDNCDGSGEVQGTDVSDENTCPEVITRTWSYTDACGNPATVSQTITVDDDTAPVLASELTDLEFTCSEDVILPVPEFTDNCSSTVEVVCSITGYPEADCETFEFPVGDTEVCWEAFDDCGNSCTPVCITVTVLPCGDDFCTLTQGFFGTPGGTYCTGETTSALLDRLLTTDLVVGLNNRTFTIPAGADQCVINILPAGGPSQVLPVGSWGCGNLGSLVNNKGELKNSLLAQTITLGLNLRLDSDLATLEFTHAEFYTLASSSCDGENPQPVPGTEIYFTGTNAMPSSVMNKFGGSPTVMEIYTLANQALANIATGVPLGDITKALGNINTGLDKCRFIYFLPPLQSMVIEPVQQQPDLNLQVSPNPFTHETTVSFELNIDSKVSLDVFNTQGVKVANIYSGNATAGTEYSYRYTLNSTTDQMFIVVLRTNYGTFSRRIISLK